MTEPTHTLLMTGASRGFGRVAAERLLRDHPAQHLVVTARYGQGERLAASLAAATGHPHVSALACDLASLESVRAATHQLDHALGAGDLPPLRGLLGNAGLQMVSATHASADGYELTFAVNVLAHYLLVRALAPRLTAPARVILVASDVHFGTFRHNLGMVPAPRWAPPATLATPGAGPEASTAAAGRRAYATSKLAVVHLVHALAQRLPPAVDVYAYNPGLVPGTGLARDAGPATRAAFRLILPLLRATPLATSPTIAGALLARAAASDAPPPAPSGAYLDRGTPARSSPESYNAAREDELWAGAARLCGLKDTN